jgi:hypothetical protein
VPSASGPIFMFCAPELIFGGPEGNGFRFHVSCVGTNFWRYRGRRVAHSCFALPNSFLVERMALGPVFMFCTTRLIFEGTEGVGSRFHVLCDQTHFRLYRVRRVLFSCFARPDSFSGVLRASGSRFHDLRSRARFRLYRRRRISISCFALPDSYSAVPRASVPVFMFCAPGLIFGGTEGVRTRFHVLRSRSYFALNRGSWVPFSCFALPEAFPAVPRASGPVFMFCAPGLVFGGTEGVSSRFHILRARTIFRWYRVRRVPFSCFALPDLFSKVPSVWGPVFMLYAPGLVFRGTEDVGSHFHVLRARTRFSRYRGRPDSFSCFALPDTYSAERMPSDPVFFFCMPRLIFEGT